MNRDSISIMHDSVRIEGLILVRTNSDIKVEITHPYGGLTTGSHIPYFCCPYIGFLGDAGEIRARELLIELYEKGHNRAGSHKEVSQQTNEA
jgi:hypothetical protein